MPSSSDLNLLFGILALQVNFITREALLNAMNAWVLEKHRSLGEILVEQGALQRELLSMLDALVSRHVEMHGNDPQQSLAAMSSVGSTRDELQHVADPEVQASLVHVTATDDGNNLNITGLYVGPSTLSPQARFRILRPHARGGLGEVFVARDEELEREVALKEIQTRHADNPESRSRFLMEAKVTGALEHPNIVPVYGLGAYSDGRPYYAMRFIRGDSLKQAVDAYHAARAKLSAGQQTLAIQGLLRRFLDVCNAIEYAHSRGVLHRDLKPDNVLVGKYGETLVVDWGLAKLLGSSERENTEGTVHPSGGDSGLTRTGAALGTPAYMSPEQAAGKLSELGPRSDVYSLGGTLYYLLTGAAPYSQREVDLVLRQVQEGSFPRPSAVCSDVPKPLEAICLKAMALQPEDRYASPEALARDVQQWLADLPVGVYREPWSKRLSRWAKRRPRLLAGSAVLVLTALVAVTLGYVLLAQEQQRTRKAEGERVEAQLDALLNAGAQAVPTILDGLAAYREQIHDRLVEIRQKEAPPEGETAMASRARRQRQTRAALSLLAEDDKQVGYLRDRLLVGELEPNEMLLLRQALLPHAAALRQGLWAEVDHRDSSATRKFRALVALSLFDPGNPRWQK